MNAATPRRTRSALRAACAIVPAAIAALHLGNIADGAHDRGVSAVVGLHPRVWRTLDVVVGSLFAPLPLGTVAARAALGGALGVAAAGALLYEIVCRLLQAPSEGSRLPYAVAAVAASTALVGAPWQVEAGAVGSSVTGALVILCALGLAMRAVDSARVEAWRMAAFALGLAAGQEPTVLVAALAGAAACTAASARGRASWVRAWRGDKMAVALWLAAGTAPLLSALVRVRGDGSWLAGRSHGAGSTDWASPSLASFASFADHELGPVLVVLAVVGAAMAGLAEGSRAMAAGLGALIAVGVAGGALGAAAGPNAFSATILAACAATCAFASVSMLSIVRAVRAARVPLAGTAAALFVVLELVVPVEAADEALVRGDRRASGTPAWWDDAIWGALAPRTVVLIEDDPLRGRADAARAQGLLRSDVVILDGNAESGDRPGPSANDLVPVWRDIALSGAPTEVSVSALASTRSLVASYQPSWGSAVARHFVPGVLLDEVEPEPRAASERRRALDASDAARQDLRTRLAGDLELCAATASLLRARQALMTSLGERDLADRAASDAQSFEHP